MMKATSTMLSIPSLRGRPVSVMCFHSLLGSLCVVCASLLAGLVTAVHGATPLPPASADSPTGPLGHVAILNDRLPVFGAGANPTLLASVLEQGGFGVEFLSAAELADPARLNRGRVDVLMLPFGASFPVSAAPNFREFLRSGGKFLSLGGYAFDRLLESRNGAWRDYQPPDPPSLDGVAWFFDIPAADLRGKGPVTFRGFLRSSGVAGPGFAHFSVYQIAADGSLPAWRDLCQVRGTQEWTEHLFTFDVHPKAVNVSLRAGLYRCHGDAWFDDIRLTDASGNTLFQEDFENPARSDQPRPRHWWRSHRERCREQSLVTHSGTNALKASLDFDLPRVERLNARCGRPEDGLELEPGQLGVFQADYPLERACFMAPAPDQCIVGSSWRWQGDLAGWAACGVVGWNQARWIPVIHAYDRHGRLRGAVGGLLRHYAGPWTGSSWAIFGVTNRDLFASDQPQMHRALVDVTGALVRDTYLASLAPDCGCYRQGESVRFIAPVFNGGRHPRQLRLRLEVREGEPSDNSFLPLSSDPAPAPTRPSLALIESSFVVPPRATHAPPLQWKPRRFRADFYHLTGSLWEDGKEIDRLGSALLVWNDRVAARGPSLSVADNYLRLGRRPMFMFGTDDWSYVFNTDRETPLQWLRDMRQRRDFGVQIYENLQFAIPAAESAATPPPRSDGYEQVLGTPPQLSPREHLFRKVDGLVQLAQKSDQVYFAGLLIGYNAAASDADLARQRDYCRDFARRYGSVPGLIYYLNGDYRCDPNPGVMLQWNAFLSDRYGSDERLRQAWGRFAPPQALGRIPSEDYRDWEQTWEDVSAYDRNCFRAWLLRRWNSALISGIRDADRAHPTSGEFYQLPHGGVDLSAGIDGLDLANFGFFEKRGADLAKFPSICLFNDQRARGKPGGPGEYGVKTHPAWGDGKDYGYHTARTSEEALDLFLGVAHCAFGLGAARIHNWCWKDDAHRVFPWGMIYPADGVPRDTAYAHRNQSLLFRHFAPLYEPPQVCVLTPDCHRMGGAKWRVLDGALACFDLLLSSHAANIGTLNESDFAVAPSTKVIFHPLPFCLPDETYGRILAWVRQGGVLYLSGDLSFDELRRRTRLPRLEELCGVRFVAENFPNISISPTNAADLPCLQVAPAGAKVLRAAPGGQPLLVEHRLGHGRVFFSTDPIELHATPTRRPEHLATYRQVLDAAGLRPLGVQPDDPSIQAFRVPLRDRGQVWILFSQHEKGAAREVTLTDLEPPVTLAVAPKRPALLWLDARGALRAVETQGRCRTAGQTVLRDETGGIALALDGLDLRQSRALVLMPLKTGSVELARQRALSKLAVEAGEIGGGAWHAFVTKPARIHDRILHIAVGPDELFTWLLACEPDQAPRWRRSLERAITDPESLP